MYLLISVIVGLIFGSFLNAWVWRTREGIAIYTGRSMCPACRHTIRFIDNIPLISFFFLRGKCHVCHQPISLQYPLVELALATLFVLTAYIHLQGEWLLSAVIRDFILLFLLLFIFVYDLLYREIWDHVTTIPALIYIPIALLLGWQPWSSLVLGAVIGGGFFLLQYGISKGRWVGGGDVRMGFFMGVILGFPHILLALLIAYVLGAVWNLGLIAFKKRSIKESTAFGTYLAIATVITMFWGAPIIQWYMNLLA